MPEKLKIMLVDDHYLVRVGLATIIALEADMTVCVEASTAEQAIALFRTWRPDVTLMDLRLPGASGSDATRAIRAEFPDARIIILSTYVGDEEIYTALQIEIRRTMRDLDVAFFHARVDGLNANGIRLLIPVPPSVRRSATTHPPGVPLRLLPVDRVSLDYRDQAGNLGRPLRGVASREDYLSQLNRPGLAVNAYRYRAARGSRDSALAGGDRPTVSLTGTTGFINTPWCGVMSDRGVEMGYSQIPKAVAYDHRGSYRNDVYYVALGFLPRVSIDEGVPRFVDWYREYHRL